ncbi:carbonic anhydrase, putative [Ixodes scapularis]|uniref:Carbonic anhydrase, putative n=1 Tax=Ixodes scapularis TaxID=6945 RepID=B7QE13_IXOSC|nr:carbonic anhydrase, putative [Ixodes scapularis]|eukprot:XP_002413777.1 carbonic anhydrase, putative [Ixodes scapularis]
MPRRFPPRLRDEGRLTAQSKGRRQSPVNLNPGSLLFDPHLKPLHIDKSRISGLVTNTGHGVIFRVSDTLAPGLAVNISGGPLSYQYRVHELHIHYGRSDDRGSEHTVAGKPFPAEVRTGGPSVHRRTVGEDSFVTVEGNAESDV